MHADRNVRDRRHLLAAVGAGVALRLVAAVFFGNEIGERLPGVADQLSYHTLAVRVIDGHGFSFGTGWWPATPAGQPTAHWSYLYTWFLAGIYAAIGPNPLGARVLQALATGVLHPYLTSRIGGRLGGPRAARGAAYAAAVYPYFVYYGAALMTEAFYFVTILWTIDLAITLGDGEGEGRVRSRREWLWFGVATAATVLLRQAFLFCVPIVWLWIAARRIATARRTGQRAGAVLPPLAAGTVLALAVMVLCVTPVTVRNYRAFHRFVPINTNAGFAFFWGNHPVHGNTFMPLLPGTGARYGELIPDELRHLNEAELDQALLARGLEFVTAEPVRYLRLTGGRIREYFKFWPSAESGLASNVLRLSAFGLLLPIAALGIALVRRRSDGGDATPVDQGIAMLLLAVATVYTALHVLVWALVRYRLPVDALLMPFAGVSLAWMAGRVRAARWLSPIATHVSATR